ncbi:GNAT family acetyltransferase [Tardiphaga sp. vice352]|uniref:GNAT family acetyltransferase n=1 Tax=unclassified Tardiphaga TaxID=2631404 RepID=UPI0011644F75|nr:MULTISPECIES: GNAT family acetyltransferase [unclassified Tardiphaga]QDM15466.1 GNAT family acetyltransferase [Tardiphaga sp. vice278]QDM20508.1 GNAT family acetyltransferase [Tardiphaga sp. vice154]QDM25630.1 GNAT family acetyltransferase [Tardiphaga sp. vice304]QDM30849.1 GNAT family acetyltransferase [Tardiphaga sp. vice352]
MRDDTGLAIAEITDADIADVISLWQRSGSTRPWNDPTRDIAFARESDNSTILIGRDGSAVMASVMVGHDGHRGWVYYVATDPDHRHKGYGRATMQAAEDWLRQRGVEKLQLMVRADNTQVQAFYESLGFGEQKRVIYAKWLDGRPLTP